MRRLWPPTYDRFSVRIWAAFCSTAINLLLWGFLVSGLEGIFWWMVPGLIPAFYVSAVFGFGEGEFVAIIGAAIVIIGNFGFYYLVSWVVINMFAPSTNWWPEKHKESK